MRDEGGHGACVDDWLDRNAKQRSADALLDLFELALNALWQRTHTTLGEVTLTAIMDRVLHIASEQFAFIAEIRVDPKVGVSCAQLRSQVRCLDPLQFSQGVRFVLVEFLVVLGNLTAEVLTPTLHAALGQVALPATAAPQESRDTAERRHWSAATPGQTHDEEN